MAMRYDHWPNKSKWVRYPTSTWMPLSKAKAKLATTTYGAGWQLFLTSEWNVTKYQGRKFWPIMRYFIIPAPWKNKDRLERRHIPIQCTQNQGLAGFMQRLSLRSQWLLTLASLARGEDFSCKYAKLVGQILAFWNN